MLYCHRLEILNFWTQGATFSLVTGSGKLCRQFWILSIHQPKWERQPALSSTSLSCFVVFVNYSNVITENELDITYTWWRCNNAWRITDATFTKSQKEICFQKKYCIQDTSISEHHKQLVMLPLNKQNKTYFKLINRKVSLPNLKIPWLAPVCHTHQVIFITRD